MRRIGKGLSLNPRLLLVPHHSTTPLLHHPIDQIDPPLMTSPVEGRFEPDTDDFERGFEGHHALTQRQDIRVIVLAA